LLLNPKPHIKTEISIPTLAKKGEDKAMEAMEAWSKAGHLYEAEPQVFIMRAQGRARISVFRGKTFVR
jgi:hypothetical protein